MSDYTVGVDVGVGESIGVEDRYMKANAEFPNGSWLNTVDGKVMIATGYYATIYPDKPSPYFHDGPPFVVMERFEYPWENGEETNGR